jgi:ABC-type multidrug transport system fused ATPase/permease subunit
LRGTAASKSGPLLQWLDAGYASARRFAEAVGVSVRFAIPVLLFAALLAKNLFTYISEFELNGIGVAMVRDLRRDAYARLLQQSTRFYSQGSTGDLMSRMLSDVEQIQHAFGHNLTDLVQGTLTLLLLLVYVFSLDFRLALLVFALAPLVLLPIVTNTRRLGRAATLTRERIGEMGALLSETLRANSVIKTYAMEPFEEKRFHGRQRGVLPRQPEDRPDPGPELPADGDAGRDRPGIALRLRRLEDPSRRDDSRRPADVPGRPDDDVQALEGHHPHQYGGPARSLLGPAHLRPHGQRAGDHREAASAGPSPLQRLGPVRPRQPSPTAPTPS